MFLNVDDTIKSNSLISKWINRILGTPFILRTLEDPNPSIHTKKNHNELSIVD